MSAVDLVEAGIADLRAALEDGRATSLELVRGFLERIRRHDASGLRLNSVVVQNPEAEAEAAASDARRLAGRALGPLDGIPYTAKDSYMVRGLTVAAGSPAFEHLTAQRDAFTIERLRGAGAICIGLTNMPPMANGGMQRGVYGRAESPYNADYLTSAYGSGSSNGSGTATAPASRRSGWGRRPGRAAGRPRRTTVCTHTRPRAESSPSGATGRSFPRWTSSCRTRVPWRISSRCSM